MNKQNMEKQQGHSNTQISRKSHNDAFAATPSGVLIFLFLSIVDHFGRRPCDVNGGDLIHMVAREGDGRNRWLRNGIPRILPDRFFWFGMAQYRFEGCLGRWGNRDFFRKRVMLWKPTKLAQLYFLVKTQWAIFRIVVPERAGCLYRKNISAISTVHEPCLRVSPVDILVASVWGCRLLVRIDHPTLSCAPRQGAPPGQGSG